MTTRRLSRRGFLTGATATALAVPALAVPALARPVLADVPDVPDTAMGQRVPNPALGQQWYMIRTLLDQDFEGTWARVADLGYRNIELGPSLFGRTPAQLRELFDSLKLKVVSRMVSLQIVRNTFEAAVEESLALGVRYLRCNSIPASQNTLDGYRQIARDFNAAGAIAREAGIRFGHHNHLREFQPIDGVVPLELLLAETDPHLFDLQLDIGWAVRAGVDVIDFMTAHPYRVGTFHLKDVAADGSEAAIGAGTIDWAAIYDFASRQRVRMSIVDLDNPPDPWASVSASYSYLRQLTF
ncbi:sugar phosphate isomerase/epimerase family protein [Jiangella asiatica]|uniref:Sugar phosphate isomerase/epimerase n=1 Tax=Jiangella asiatica TaxID=2530372 RepID=A0A4R5CLR9_9ACTN|nr:sugar phosphate isomerase/epimerase [Jiangella asiatica]TDE00217.1 sugar phosphate isomerase/epimerase [Jiangella asiatica]